MTENRTTPFGLWRYGNDFRRAADSVLMNVRNEVFMPYYFLLGQSIELSLKAFLLAKGTTLKELRNRELGHNLKEILKLAVENNIGNIVELKNVHHGAIEILSIEYLDRRYQYIETGRMLLPEPQLAHEAADLLSNGLNEFCYEHTI